MSNTQKSLLFLFGAPFLAIVISIVNDRILDQTIENFITSVGFGIYILLIILSIVFTVRAFKHNERKFFLFILEIIVIVVSLLVGIVFLGPIGLGP